FETLNWKRRSTWRFCTGTLDLVAESGVRTGPVQRSCSCSPQKLANEFAPTGPGAALAVGADLSASFWHLAPTGPAPDMVIFRAFEYPSQRPDSHAQGYPRPLVPHAHDAAVSGRFRLTPHGFCNTAYGCLKPNRDLARLQARKDAELRRSFR